MKNRPSISRKILYNDNLLKILSLVAAVLFWFVIVISVSTDYKKTIYNIPVTIDENVGALTSLGLHVVDTSPKTVNVEVSGPRNLIGALTSKDFNIKPYLNNVTKTGTYDIDVTASLKVPDNRIKIIKTSPEKVNVKFDTILTKTLPVSVVLDGGSVPEGYLMQQAISSPVEITVSGPTSELSEVWKAVATAKIGSGVKKTILQECDVVLFDTSGKEINNDHILISSDKVDITVPVLKTKTLPLKVNFTNVPEGFDSTQISYSITPKQILVAGDEETIDKTSEIVVGEINFNSLDLKTTKTMDIPDIDGIKNIENVTSAQVNVTLNGIGTKTVDATDFETENVPGNLTVTNLTKKISAVKLFGPSDSVGLVENLTAVIDMGTVTGGSGQYEVPVEFKVPGKTGYWVTQKFSVVVYVKS